MKGTIVWKTLKDGILYIEDLEPFDLSKESLRDTIVKALLRWEGFGSDKDRLEIHYGDFVLGEQ